MKLAWIPLTLALAITTFSAHAFAQEETGRRKSEKPSAKEMKSETDEAPQPKPVTGRLPRYFASIVDARQRVEIYAIQNSFRLQIQELEEQLEALKQSEMSEIESVLTATQRKRLDELRSDAAQRLKERNAESIPTKVGSSKKPD